MSAVPASACPRCRQEKKQQVIGVYWTLPAPLGGGWVAVPFRVKQTRCGACGTQYVTPGQAEGAVRAAESAVARTQHLLRRR